MTAAILRQTTARDQIWRALQRSHRHLSAMELYSLFQRSKVKIGLATIYRGLAFLTQRGLVARQAFAREEARYEVVDAATHHDHLICEKCGTIVEFENDTIEQLQKEIAKQYGFELTSHQLNLFGQCRKCQAK